MSDVVVPGTTRTQAGATLLDEQISRIDSSTAPASGSILGDGICLPVVTSGAVAAPYTIVNNSQNPIQLYASGADTINGIAGSTGVALWPGLIASAFLATAGQWHVLSARAVDALGGISVAESNVSSSAGSAINVAASNPVNTRARFSEISAQNYGVLVNTQGQISPSGSKASVIGCDINTVSADCIEYNAPSVGGVASFKGTIAALNFLQNTATSGGTTAGFAIGAASPLYNVVMGNVTLASRLEQIHIEDSQRCTSVVGNVGAGLGDGIKATLAASQNSTPATFVANALENSSGSPTKTGVNLFWYTPGSMNGASVVANMLHNYATGIYCGGVATGAPNTVTMVANNSIVGCTYGLGAHGNQNQGTVRQYGANAVIGAATSAFMTEAHSVRFGKIITDQDISASVVIANTGAGAYNGEIPSMCDGFEMAANGITATTGGVTKKLFTAGGPYRGRVKCQFKGVSPVTDWCHLSADINWDGTTFTSSNVLSRVHGQVSTITLGNASGSPQVTIVSTANTYLQAGWIEFDGEYWDA